MRSEYDRAAPAEGRDEASGELPSRVRKALAKSRGTVTVTVKATGALKATAKVRLRVDRTAKATLFAAGATERVFLCRFGADGRLIASRRVH